VKVGVQVEGPARIDNIYTQPSSAIQEYDIDSDISANHPQDVQHIDLLPVNLAHSIDIATAISSSPWWNTTSHQWCKTASIIVLAGVIG
jgi:hypothetical protein